MSRNQGGGYLGGGSIVRGHSVGITEKSTYRPPERIKAELAKQEYQELQHKLRTIEREKLALRKIGVTGEDLIAIG